jgi:phage terminase large subunit-like protein
MSQVLLSEIDELQAALEEERNNNKFLRYTPYAKQIAFHSLRARERLLIAANQVGKTYGVGMEYSYHVCGWYPDWWPDASRRFTHPITGWTCGVSLEGLRDGAQRILLGNVGQEGTGAIPKKRIIQIARKQNNAVDFIRVRWGDINGSKESFVSFKSYDQGRQKFQAASVDLVWFDEEPPADIYTEGVTRTNATKGDILITFTPLEGVTEVVQKFLYENNPDRAYVNMTIEDAQHISKEERDKIIRGYKPHEVEARTKGIPILGSGRIYPVEEALVAIESFPIPKHWPRLGAMDFGWDHPFAAVELVWDREADVIYVVKAWRIDKRTPAEQAAVLRLWGDELPWAWPHDGLNTEKGTGEALAKQYRKHKLKLTEKRATFPDGSNSVEAGLLDILQRMQGGRFRVFSNLLEWFEEFRLYHRKDGKIVKAGDDLMDATRYGVMMIRHAKVTDSAILRNIRDNKATVALGTGEVAL